MSHGRYRVWILHRYVNNDSGSVKSVIDRNKNDNYGKILLLSTISGHNKNNFGEVA